MKMYVSINYVKMNEMSGINKMFRVLMYIIPEDDVTVFSTMLSPGMILTYGKNIYLVTL